MMLQQGCFFSPLQSSLAGYCYKKTLVKSTFCIMLDPLICTKAEQPFIRLLQRQCVAGQLIYVTQR